MAITLNSNRQQSRWASVSFTYADIASGTAATAVKLPVGAVVVGGQLTVTTAFNSGTSDVIVVGDATTSNRYLTSTSIASAARTALVPTGYAALSTTREVQVTWTAVGAAATAGAVRLEVEYINPSRGDAQQD